MHLIIYICMYVYTYMMKGRGKEGEKDRDWRKIKKIIILNRESESKGGRKRKVEMIRTKSY